MKYLRDNKESLGLSSTDIAGVLVADEYSSAHNGVTRVYLRQRYHGFEVHGANININIAADGSGINLGNRFVPGIESAINTTTIVLNRGQAISSAARSLGLDESKGNISRKPIPSKPVYQPVAKNLVRLAWDLEIYEMDAQNWWSMRIDAVTGSVLDQVKYVVQDNFNVYEAPVESPSHGSRSNAVNPEDTAASVSGWVDSQCTKGNNVDAYIDDKGSNSPTAGDVARACDPGLNFSFPVDLGQEPSQYQNAAVTNLGGADLTWDVMTDSFGTFASPDNCVTWANAAPTIGTAPPSGSDDVAVSFDSNPVGPGEYDAVACIISNDPDEPLVIVPLSLTIEGLAPTVDQLASGEIPGTGSVSANYSDTRVDDGISQQLTEQHQGGRPKNRHDALIYTWIFNLDYGIDVTFNGNLWKSGAAGDNESFGLYWSPDNSSYTLFKTFNSTDGGNLICEQLNLPTAGQAGPGPLYIRIEDSDRIPTHNQNERVLADYLALTEDTSGTPPPPPPEPITMIVYALDDVSTTSSRRNRYTAIARATVVDRNVPANAVEGALVSGTFSNGVNGGGSCTTDSSGQCTITKANVKTNVSPVNFTVDSVARGSDEYDDSGAAVVDLSAP